MSMHVRIIGSFFFFFQAEDGIRDYKVTGVQTCALPIWGYHLPRSRNRSSSPPPVEPTSVTPAHHRQAPVPQYRAGLLVQRKAASTDASFFADFLPLPS